jgi:hypothetical protein
MSEVPSPLASANARLNLFLGRPGLCLPLREHLVTCLEVRIRCLGISRNSSADPRGQWLRVPPTTIVPLSASERQSGWLEERSTKEILAAVLPGGSGRDRYSGTSERASHFSPVVYTCGISVLQDLRRTMSVLSGL